MNRTIKEIAESLLGRPLSENDGINNTIIQQAESRLGIKLPEALKEFYALMGNLEIFTSSFECFMTPDELEYEDSMLIFLDENQGVCQWAVNIIDDEDATVYMVTINDDKPIWHSEEVTLEEFLKVVMYLQYAEGGCEYGYAVYESDFEDRQAFEVFHAETTADWEKVVDHNGFVAYQKKSTLIWYFSDSKGQMEDILYASTQTEEDSKELELLGFTEL